MDLGPPQPRLLGDGAQSFSLLLFTPSIPSFGPLPPIPREYNRQVPHLALIAPAHTFLPPPSPPLSPPAHHLQVSSRVFKYSYHIARVSAWIEQRVRASISKNSVYPGCGDIVLPLLQGLDSGNVADALPGLLPYLQQLAAARQASSGGGGAADISSAAAEALASATASPEPKRPPAGAQSDPPSPEDSLSPEQLGVLASPRAGASSPRGAVGSSPMQAVASGLPAGAVKQQAQAEVVGQEVDQQEQPGAAELVDPASVDAGEAGALLAAADSAELPHPVTELPHPLALPPQPEDSSESGGLQEGHLLMHFDSTSTTSMESSVGTLGLRRTTSGPSDGSAAAVFAAAVDRQQPGGGAAAAAAAGLRRAASQKVGSQISSSLARLKVQARAGHEQLKSKSSSLLARLKNMAPPQEQQQQQQGAPQPHAGMRIPSRRTTPHGM